MVSCATLNCASKWALIAAPIKTKFIRKYNHSIKRIKAVRLPYIFKREGKKVKYIEKTKENTDQETAMMAAPGIWLVKVAGLLGKA